MPKSMRVRLSRVSMTLEGLRSRWMSGGSNASCSSRTASQSFGNTSHARATDGSQRYTDVGERLAADELHDHDAPGAHRMAVEHQRQVEEPPARALGAPEPLVGRPRGPTSPSRYLRTYGPCSEPFAPTKYTSCVVSNALSFMTASTR